MEQGTAVPAAAAVPLATLLARGERATFHGPPGNAIPPLERAIEVARSEAREAEATAASWLLGVAYTALGRFGTAFAVLDPITAPLYAAVSGEETAPEQCLFGSLAAASIASGYRQLGQHATAREFDALGLTAAGALPGLDEAIFDCRLGLACDAIGLGELETARRELAVVTDLVEAHPDWWRQRVRLDWARAELALCEEDAGAAAEAASEAVDRAEQARAPRHVAKGLLFLGVAQAQAGAAEAEATLRRAAMLAEQLGTLPLVWLPRALLGAMTAETDPAAAASHLQAARSAVLAIAADLPEKLRESWLARPEVDALLTA
ncbi:hypothetical protein Acel_0364 [Acidothermus cellulolyticus 11B]|uniref:Tetratricopeptide TPR_4 n=1 Tax=Acidothermus cellulolyticus (strain ATCC 43068 / DSM 8971 / 11B) TaxID=351607 RepID=A0LRS8_ACIC1|nr:hypothetical protein [Acidothermus cellulolyticus]ABK52138.1 hypothetical protein Acel_0364 [Acidothermus cellulolyticus 11B]